MNASAGAADGAANWTPVPLLEEIKEHGRVWEDLASQYGVTNPDPPWKTSLDGICEALAAGSCSSVAAAEKRWLDGKVDRASLDSPLPLLERRWEEDELSETLYQDLKLVTDQVTAAVLCPYFVATGIANSHRNRPADMKNDTGPTLSQLVAQAQSTKAVSSGKITPAMIAERVFHAIDNDKFYIFSHPNALGNVATRMTDITEMRNPTDPFAERPEISAALKAKLRGG